MSSMAEGNPEKAMEYFKQAFDKQVEGEYGEAIELYTRSIEEFPTAEAFTFRGWAHSYLEDYDQAIADCKRAIEIDPEFGNPYNDIGAYLIEMGREDEAVEWLERAKRAPRYEPRHYPYFNRARVHVKRHEILEAIRELERALSIEPRYVTARRELHRLRGLLN